MKPSDLLLMLASVVLLGADPGAQNSDLGRVVITMDPGANLFVNGIFYITADESGRARVPAPPGIYEVSVVREGHADKMVRAEVIRGQDVPVDLRGQVAVPQPPAPTLDPDAPAGRLEIYTVPVAVALTCAELGFDDRRKWDDPLVIERAPVGQLALAVDALGARVSHEVTIVAGKTTVIFVDLETRVAREGRPPAPAAPKRGDPAAPVIPGFTLMRFQKSSGSATESTIPIYRCDYLARMIRLPADATAVDVEFAFVPAGDYQIRNPLVATRNQTEHELYLVRAHPFLIGVTEVTQRVWRALATRAQVASDPSRQRGSDLLPVENMSWDDANALASSASLRLPWEGEWEIACRALTTTPWCSGADPNELPRFAWFLNSPRTWPREVATLLPNAFGLHDMHGNIGEWTGTLIKNQSEAVTRGGSYAELFEMTTSGCRVSLDRRGAWVRQGVRFAASVP